MEDSFGHIPVTTPVASNVKLVRQTSGQAALRFDTDEDESSGAVHTADHGAKQIPGKRLSDLVHQPSVFHLRHQNLSKSSRLVRFSSDNSHIFNQVFDYSDSDSSAASDMGSDGWFAEETSPQPTFEVPIEYKDSSTAETSFFQRVLIGIAKAVHRSPQNSPLITSRRARESDADDGSTCEFQHSLSYTNLASLALERKEGHKVSGESQPLLEKEQVANNGSVSITNGSDSSSVREQHRERDRRENNRAARIAAAFLSDFENCRPCSLPEQVTLIRESQLRCHRLRFHPGWKATLYLAAFSLFIASSFEGADPKSSSGSKLGFCTYVPMVVFAFDIFVRRHYRMILLPSGGSVKRSGSSMSLSAHSLRSDVDLRSIVHTRKSRSRQWQWPLLLLFVALSIETATSMGVGTNRTIWSSIFKPIALFYISSNARDALEALQRVFPVVIKVIMMELFIILSFAAVATHTYTDCPSFDDLTTSFLSLFELSTTVVNPSMWMPLYNTQRSAAIFFIFFIVISVFYLHSLVLSVVFQTYILAVREIRERSFSDREDALRLAFMTLEKQIMNEEQSFPAVRTSCVRDTLAVVRPHYGPKKISVLLQVLDPDGIGLIDFDTFRTKMPKALSKSLRTTRRSTFVGGLVFEFFAALFAVVNLVYVLVLSSSHEPFWWKGAEFSLGTILTLAGLLEVLIRLNPVKLSFSAPTRFNRTFDGLAFLAAAVSGYGIFLHVTMEHDRLHTEYLLAGRAIDMMRIMRFFGIFRNIVRRSGEVLPSISGPFILVFSAMHIFTYIGTALWRDAVTVGNNETITPLYDLNNFNSYVSGLVTMFQVLVVNDWHAIAEVYLYAKRCSDPAIVYPFFIGANLISVSILLNVLTAFFVGAFVTRLDGNMSEQKQNNTPKAKGSLTDSSEFNVFERQGFDKIMETIAGDGGEESGWVKRTCEILEIFESLTPGAERFGHLVCCSQSEDRFGNRRFQILTKDFFGEDMMHMIVSDMHSELINSLAATESTKESNVQRIFDGASKQLELSASLISSRPPVSLFVARVMDCEMPGMEI